MRTMSTSTPAGRLMVLHTCRSVPPGTSNGSRVSVMVWPVGLPAASGPPAGASAAGASSSPLHAAIRISTEASLRMARSILKVVDAQAGVPRVLVVDDESSIRNLLALVVGRAGGEADTAENAGEARARLGEREYAAIILDKNLPDGSGVELLRDVKASRPGVEVLIVTGYASMESALEALRLGAFDYILKPFDVGAVTHRVKMALERRRMASDLERASWLLSTSRQEVKRAYFEAVMRLSLAAEYKDDAAAGHLRRMSRYAGLLAKAIDATEEWVEQMVYAAPLHDIGKI